ncbi:MAG: hypothetical protein ABJF11_12860 [Reichenbachiella sp.]|uniref:hypothetical protein n=1 Tax=Reichenbachiella sp. TaxID=2184521 RepID=UPI0032664646
MTFFFEIRNLSIAIFLSGVIVLSFSSCKEEGDVIFHDSFEYYDIGVPPTGPWTGSGKGVIRVDSTRSHTGDLAIYFESGEGFSERAFLKLVGTPVFPFAYNRMRGSFYLWLEEASPDGIHWTMIQASGPNKDGYSSDVRYGGQHEKRLMANYDTKGRNTDCWQHSAVSIPERQWIKIGWQFDGSKNSARFWLDDQLIEDLSIDGKGQDCLADDLAGDWVFPRFDELLIGWVDYQTGGGTRRFWIDDVKLYH